MPRTLSPKEREEITGLARRRAAILRPVAVAEVDFDGARPAQSTGIFCRIGEGELAAVPGFRRIAEYPLRTHEPLHALLGRWHPLLGRAFRPDGPFHHVGSRPCARRVPGDWEEYWVPANDAGPAVAARWEALAVAAVTVGGVGFLPAIGATTASALVTMLAGLLGIGLPWTTGVLPAVAGLAILATIVGLIAERAAERHFLDDDAREFVLDEVAGMAVTILFVPAASLWWGLPIAFVAFRFFDVLKPGIQWVEARHWRGAVMWDDLLAGLYAGAATWIVTTLIGAVIG